MVSPRRGELYWIDFRPVQGSEIGKVRPALVIQNDVGNAASATTIVAAISSRYATARYPFVVPLPEGTLPRPGVVNCAQVRTVDVSRFREGPVATLDAATMAEVDAALALSLGLTPPRACYPV